MKFRRQRLFTRSDVEPDNASRHLLIRISVECNVVIFANIDRYCFASAQLHRHRLIPGPLPVVRGVVFELPRTNGEGVRVATSFIGDRDVDGTGAVV